MLKRFVVVSLLLLAVSLNGCKRREEVPAVRSTSEQQQRNAAPDDTIVWKVTTPIGVYEGRLKEDTGNTLGIVTTDGRKVYVNGTWTLETVAN